MRIKTTFQVAGHEEERDEYFCQGVGMALSEHRYFSTDSSGVSYVTHTWRRSLDEYFLDN